MIAARQPAEPALAPASRPTVRFLDPLAVDGWDREVSQFEGATTFHSAPWCSVLKDTYGFRPWYAVCELDGVIRGVLPLMEVNNFPKGRRGISLPFTDECCALSKDGQIREQLTAALMDEGKRRQWKYVEVRGTQILDGTASLSFYTHRLDLQAGQKVLERFDSSVQRAIRKAEKSGVVVEIAHGLDAVRSFYELHQGTRQKHGGPPQPFTFFANIHRHIIEKGHGFVALARTGDRVIAAAVFFCFGKKAIYKFGASDEQFQQLRGNNLIFWKAIQMLAGNGVVELDFGRTSLENEGLRRFKLGWGTVESRIDYFKYDFKGKCFATESDAASGWHTRFFRMMPRPISRWAGAMLYNRTA